ncbi:MAG: YciI family protein [Ramlibacter sp.]
MQYLLLIYADESAMQTLTPSQASESSAAYGAYTQALQKAGVLVGGERLRPSAMATSVRLVSGKTEVLNGPYAETREQLGGYYMIDVPDLDAALSWAARCPGAGHGTMEVRPVWAM